MAAFVDAALNPLSDSNDAYLFRGGRYWRYNWQQDRLADDGWSRPLFLWHLPPDYHSGIDAALSDARSTAYNKSYFFKGNQCVLYNWYSNRLELLGGSSSQSIAGWWNLPQFFGSNLDAALSGVGSYSEYAYFFKGDQWVGYSWKDDKYGAKGYLADWHLPAPFSGGIDAAVNGYGPYTGKAFFLKDNQYLRYDWETNTVDSGYPKPLTDWPSLLEMEKSVPQRRITLYVTIDQFDHRAVDTYNHLTNITNLINFAKWWKPEAKTLVDDFWCPDIVSSILDDKHLLALFLAGSYDEWVGVFRNKNWADQLDKFCDIIKATRVPVLGVCGSHQLLGSAYASAGWGAVRHMCTPVLVSDEADGIFKAFNPRVGEVGVFGDTVKVKDPIFDGLPGTVSFIESHHDEVVDESLPSCAVSLLAPGGVSADDAGAFYMGKAVIDPGPPKIEADYYSAGISQDLDRCRVQMIRYDVDPPGRLLYTTQFHPELTEIKGKHAGEDGKVLVQSFLRLAANYWSNLGLGQILGPDVYMRDALGDVGKVPSLGAVSISPDIIVTLEKASDAQATYGEGSGTEESDTLSDNVKPGQENFIYVRIRNRGTDPAPGTRATIYWSEVSTLVTPDQWRLIGTTEPVDVTPGNTLHVAGPLVWRADDLPSSLGHACFVAILNQASDLAPTIPSTHPSFDWNAFVSFVRDSNNVTWRNFVVDEPALSAQSVNFDFLITGSPDEARAFDFEICQRLPLDVEVALEVPPDLAAALPRECWSWGELAQDDRRARLVLPPSPSLPLQGVHLAAGVRHSSRLVVRCGSKLPPGLFTVAIRQIYNGTEVGRVTWGLRAHHSEPGAGHPGCLGHLWSIVRSGLRMLWKALASLCLSFHVPPLLWP